MSTEIEFGIACVTPNKERILFSSHGKSQFRISICDRKRENNMPVINTTPSTSSNWYKAIIILQSFFAQFSYVSTRFVCFVCFFRENEKINAFIMIFIFDGNNFFFFLSFFSFMRTRNLCNPGICAIFPYVWVHAQMHIIERYFAIKYGNIGEKNIDKEKKAGSRGEKNAK